MTKRFALVLLAFVLVLGLAGCSKDKSGDAGSKSADAASASTAAEQPATSEPVAPAEPAVETPAEPAAPAVTGYEPGMYKVGTDIPAGEYVLEAQDDSCYFQVDKNSSGEFDAIIANDNFSNRSILTVKKGQYLTVNGARIVPFAKATKPVPQDGLLPEGMYKVGVDIAAGEYKVIPDGSGYLEVDRNSTHDFNAIVSNDNFDNPRYIKVAKGRYLKLSRASIKVK